MPGKKPGKCLFRAGHFAQLSPEIGARIAIQTARTWMDMDINGSHRTYAFSLRKKNTPVTFFWTPRYQVQTVPVKPIIRLLDLYQTDSIIHFHKVISSTPEMIRQAPITILGVTFSTSLRKRALKVNEKRGPVLAMGMTTVTFPRSKA